jgi:hypothetical protein
MSTKREKSTMRPQREQSPTSEQSAATPCQHEADWETAGIHTDSFVDGCSVALCCRHCDENAWADLGPEHFRWNDESPVAPPWDTDTPPTEPPPPRSRAS